MYIYMYIYIYICVCVCGERGDEEVGWKTILIPNVKRQKSYYLSQLMDPVAISHEWKIFNLNILSWELVFSISKRHAKCLKGDKAGHSD